MPDVTARSDALPSSMDEELGPVRAPELDGAVAWLNTPAPLTLAQLRGKIVLLDFWTYGCINCLHVLPDLQRLQAKFADVLVVIGIHAAKFDNERSTENIRRTLQRLGIGHPVANDAQFAIWQAYTVRAWPTQVLIDPRGYVVGTATGEGHGAQLEEVITAVAAVFDAGGHARPHAASADAGGDRGTPGRWRSPARCSPTRRDRGSSSPTPVTTASSRRTWPGASSACSATARQAATMARAGSARFRAPQGMALDGDTLWVADAGNHSIRRIDLVTRAGDARRPARGGRPPGSRAMAARRWRTR